MASLKARNPSQHPPKIKGKGCCCAKVPKNETSSDSCTDKSSSSTSDSSDTTEWSSESEFTSSDTDESVQLECMCKVRKRGGKRKAEARASAAKIHERNKKKSSRRGRRSSSSDYSTEYESSDEFIPVKGRRKCCR